MTAGCGSGGDGIPGSGNGTSPDDGGTDGLGPSDSVTLNDAASLDPDVDPITEGGWYRPAVDTTWHWQLQPDAAGEIRTDYAVDAYDIDLFNVDISLIAQLHAQGRKVICYFSAGTFEPFREDADEFGTGEQGRPLEDFPDELWLDIRSSNRRGIMRNRLDLAVQKGCDAVEPDNVDGFENRTGFDLSAADQLVYNRFIANEAHQRGLAVGLKNDLTQILELVEYFDFSVNEQCHEFDECELLQPFIDGGKPVFNAEYLDRFVNDPAAREDLCADTLNLNLRTLVLPVGLDDSFRFSCDE